MLLPALNQAREKARAISCTNNLKQLGSAFALYSDACNYLPNGTSWTDAWTWRVAPYLGVALNSSGKFELEQDIRVFACPSRERSFSESYDGPACGKSGLSYVIAMVLSNGNARVNSKLMSFSVGSVKRASERAILVEGGDGIGLATWGENTARITYRHGATNFGQRITAVQRPGASGGGCNITCLDGHVATWRGLVPRLFDEKGDLLWSGDIMLFGPSANN